jgi:hypothetical protein
MQIPDFKMSLIFEIQNHSALSIVMEADVAFVEV